MQTVEQIDQAIAALPDTGFWYNDRMHWGIGGFIDMAPEYCAEGEWPTSIAGSIEDKFKIMSAEQVAYELWSDSQLTAESVFDRSAESFCSDSDDDDMTIEPKGLEALQAAIDVFVLANPDLEAMNYEQFKSRSWEHLPGLQAAIDLCSALYDDCLYSEDWRNPIELSIEWWQNKRPDLFKAHSPAAQ